MTYADSIATRHVARAQSHASEDAHRTRVAVVCDLREENWHSMNLVADSLIENLESAHAGPFPASRVCPPLRRRFSRAGETSGRRFNADRLFNRFLDYPR